MSAAQPSASKRLPHAGVDPICSAGDALAVFALQLAHPLSPETLAMFVDASGCATSLVTVSGTVEPGHLVDVAEMLATVLGGRADISGVVLASVRPGGGVLTDDDTLWFEADAALNDGALVLYDWLVIGRGGTRSMREELGVPSRWPSRT